MATYNGTSAPCWSPKIGQLIAHIPNCGLRDNQKDARYVSHKADHDDENRFELFLLDDGQSKVEYKEETRKYPAQLSPPARTDPPYNRCPQHRHLHLQQGRPHARQPSLAAPPQIRLYRLLRLQGPPSALRDFRAPRLDRWLNYTQRCYRPVLQGCCD
jgi:hypothetical protein